MYLVIRCPGCGTFTYIDRYQRWKLCYNCGEAINTTKSPTYLEVRNYTEADNIVKELERYLHKTGKADFTETEKERLHAEYARWLRKRL